MSLFGKKDKKPADATPDAAPEAPTDGHDHAHDHDHDQGHDDGWFLPQDSREYLEKVFADLKDVVRLEVYTRRGDNDPYNEAMTGFTRDLARLSGGKITVDALDADGDEAAKRGVSASPTLLIQPDSYRMGYMGAPLGEEARTFIETIIQVSHGKSMLSDVSRQLLDKLDQPRDVKVFMNPDCPYCPGQVAHAFRAAMERPDLVAAMAIETNENMELARRYEATALPLTVIDETFRQKGLLPEERFVLELVALRPAEELLKEHSDLVPEGLAAPTERADAQEVDVVVAGAGPAGLTVAIYAERSGLKSLVLEKGMIGGQVALTPEVENYPGFKKVGGIQLMEMIAEHAKGYGDVRQGEEVLEVRVGKDIEVATSKGLYRARAMVFATGAHSRMLGVPGEQTFYGRGVSVCASCDGWAYKGKRVILVGGGNTALTEALHLHNLGVGVTIVHRRDAFRAERHLQDSVANAGIEVAWNSEVAEFLGRDGELSGVRLRDTVTGDTRDVDVDGAFLAIGWIPNSQLAQDMGVRVDDYGYIRVDRHMRTNIPRIYACGDVIGGVQQIVTAVGEGSTAALSLFEDLSNPYWKKTLS